MVVILARGLGRLRILGVFCVRGLLDIQSRRVVLDVALLLWVARVEEAGPAAIVELTAVVVLLVVVHDGDVLRLCCCKESGGLSFGRLIQKAVQNGGGRIERRGLSRLKRV